MRGCRSCDGGLRSLFSGKLGRCTACMRAVALGALVGWAAVAAAWWVGAHPAWVAAALAIGAGFTLLLLAHLVALVVRVAALWEAMRAAAPSEVQRQWPARRVFLVSLVGATLANLVPSVPGQRLEGVAALLRSVFGAAGTRSAHAQMVQGRTVRVVVTDATGNGCKNIRVELHPDPPCVLHRRKGRGVETFCTDTSFAGGAIPRARTGKDGVAEFRAVAPGNKVVCLCDSDCVERGYPVGCDFECDGPSQRLTVPPLPERVPEVTLILDKCECKDKKDK